jgi:hypothetical protein
MIKGYIRDILKYLIEKINIEQKDEDLMELIKIVNEFDIKFEKYCQKLEGNKNEL